MYWIVAFDPETNRPLYADQGCLSRAVWLHVHGMRVEVWECDEDIEVYPLMELEAA